MPAFHTSRKPIVQDARQHRIRDPEFVIPHMETYAGLFRQVNKSYYVWYDQAQQNSLENSLAMRNDTFIEELLRHRQMPVMNLPYSVVVDDADDPRQKSIGDTLEKIVRNIPRLKYIMLYLLDAIFYGKSGAEIQLGRRKVAGNTWNSIINSIPINGDKIRYLSDGTPGIAIRTGADSDYTNHENAFLNAYSDCIMPTMLGSALFLKQPFLRDRFIIHNFNPSDSDYLFELEQQLSVYGLGLRSRLYWFWNLRTELLSWMVNALQRVGANGMIFGFFEEGNPAMEEQVLQALQMLIQNNYAAFPVKGGMAGATSSKGVIDRIEPAAVGYDILMQLIEWCEGIMRRAFLGQDLSSVAKPTGIGAGAAQLQGDVRADYIEYDAGLLAETLTEQLLNVIMKYNKFIYDDEEIYGDELPFSCRLEFNLTRENVTEAIQAASQLHEMGVELDADDLRRKAGLAPPKHKKTTVANPQHQQASREAKAMPGMHRASKRIDGFSKKLSDIAKQAAIKGNGRHHREFEGSR